MFWKDIVLNEMPDASLINIIKIQTGDKVIIVDGIYKGKKPVKEDEEYPEKLGGLGRYWYYDGSKKNISLTIDKDEEDYINKKKPKELWKINTIKMWLDNNNINYKTNDTKKTLFSLIENVIGKELEIKN